MWIGNNNIIGRAILYCYLEVVVKENSSKKPKKAQLTQGMVVTATGAVKCPHCNITIADLPMPEYILMLQCHCCGGPIDLRPDEKYNDRGD